MSRCIVNVVATSMNPEREVSSISMRTDMCPGWCHYSSLGGAGHHVAWPHTVDALRPSCGWRRRAARHSAAHTSHPRRRNHSCCPRTSLIECWKRKFTPILSFLQCTGIIFLDCSCRRWPTNITFHRSHKYRGYKGYYHSILW